MLSVQVEAAPAALREVRLREAEAASTVQSAAESGAAWPELLEAARTQAEKVDRERKTAEAVCDAVGIDATSINFDATVLLLDEGRHKRRTSCCDVRLSLIAFGTVAAVALVSALLFFLAAKKGWIQNPDRPAELAALRAFKASSGDRAGLESWARDDPCSGWAGVSCTGRLWPAVTGINLRGPSSLTGNATVLASLPRLKRLDLGHTKVFGTIPEVRTPAWLAGWLAGWLLHAACWC